MQRPRRFLLSQVLGRFPDGRFSIPIESPNPTDAGQIAIDEKLQRKAQVKQKRTFCVPTCDLISPCFSTDC
jgi:hypothetical protein